MLRPSGHWVFTNANLETGTTVRLALAEPDMRFTDELITRDTTIVRADAQGYPVYAASVTVGQRDSTRMTFIYKQ